MFHALLERYWHRRCVEDTRGALLARMMSGSRDAKLEDFLVETRDLQKQPDRVLPFAEFLSTAKAYNDGLASRTDR